MTAAVIYPKLWNFDVQKYKMGITDVVEDYLPFHVLPVLVHQGEETPFEGNRVSVHTGKKWLIDNRSMISS